MDNFHILLIFITSTTTSILTVAACIEYYRRNKFDETENELFKPNKRRTTTYLCKNGMMSDQPPTPILTNKE